jgi:hypothetical protein
LGASEVCEYVDELLNVNVAHGRASFTFKREFVFELPTGGPRRPESQKLGAMVGEKVGLLLVGHLAIVRNLESGVTVRFEVVLE